MFCVIENSRFPAPACVLDIGAALAFSRSVAVAVVVVVVVAIVVVAGVVGIVVKIQDAYVYVALLDLRKTTVGLPVEHGSNQNLVGSRVRHNGNVAHSAVVIIVIAVVIVIIIVVIVCSIECSGECLQGPFLDDPRGFALAVIVIVV